MTNFERIKNMTVDQLANSELLSCRCCIYHGNKDKCISNRCKDGMKEWLNQEVKYVKIKKVKKMKMELF